MKDIAPYESSIMRIDSLFLSYLGSGLTHSQSKMQDGYIVINNGVVEWKEKKAFEDLYEEEPNYLEPVLDEKLASIFDSLYAVNENIDKYKHKDTTLIYSTPTDEEIKQSEKELNEDLKKHDKHIGFYWLDSLSNEEIEK